MVEKQKEKEKEKEKKARKRARAGEPDERADLAEDVEAVDEGPHDTTGEGAEPEETGTSGYQQEQRRKEAEATRVDRPFPEKYRISGEMEGCSQEEQRALFERLLVTREFDARMRKLFRQGRFEGTFYSQIGQEACDVVIAFQLEREDFVGPSHRDLGASIGKEIPLESLAAHIYSRVDSPDGGRYTACHYWHPDHWVMQPATSICMNWVAATGAAFGFKMLKKPLVAVAFCGDGATAHGDFHEACNFAGVHRLPIVYVVQNNLWAESLPLSLTTALTDLSHRADAFGFPGVSIDGNNVVTVWNTTRQALARARSGGGPTLIEMKTYRWFGHSDIDPADYRSDEEVEAWMEKDPLPRYVAYLKERDVLDDDSLGAIRERVAQAVEAAVDFAENSPRPEAEAYLSHVYAEEYPGFSVGRRDYGEAEEA